MNKLHVLTEERLREVEALRDASRRKHAATRQPALMDYPLPHLKERIRSALSDSWGQGRLQVQFDIIERRRFGGDIALKFPQLLGNGGPKAFASDHLPWIASRLSESDFEDAIERVDKAGMYVNLTLADSWFREGARTLADHGDGFGRNDSLSEATIVVDYSGPNVAKTLHAGHIRSTIVGHVLSNLYEAAGALVYRVNHVNDFGGFGFILEGWRRFASSFPAEFGDNDKLLEVYRIRRTAERVLASASTWDDVTAQDREVLSRYFPDADGLDTLRAGFDDFTSRSNERFARLEVGDEDEVDLWAQLVTVSLRDFDSFYDALNIRFDFVLGESFYYEVGNALVEDFLANGQARVFTESDVAAEIERLDGELTAGKITSDEYDTFVASAAKDTGAVVVPLDDGVRLIVRRADGRSIYATRDLGAVKLRREVLGATDMVYVVGQEQRVHFERLFRAAYALGLATPEIVRFQHLYFGFYVDARSGRKLSSRDSVANVTQILTAAFTHFRSSLSDRSHQSPETIEKTATELAVGSLVFNDLKKDIRSPVEIDGADLAATIEGFEKGGGAYVIYSAVRAGSVLRRSESAEFRDEPTDPVLDEQEITLLLRLQQMPEIVAAAAERAEPSVLVRHLLDISTVYNSYYARVTVISNGVVDPWRLQMTRAVHNALRAALAFCHVDCPQTM